MQSSFKIIKSEYVKAQPGLSLIETKLDFPIETLSFPDELLAHEFEEVEEEIEDENEEEIDIEEIRKEIRNQLYMEIEEEKRLILSKAKEKAEGLKLEAREEGFKHGIKKGFLEGYKKGEEEAKKDCQAIKENALKLVEQAEEQVQGYFIENQGRIIRLAADMAESIIHKSIDSSSDNLLMLINPILQQYRKKEQIIITAHPENSEFLRNNLDKLKDNNPDTSFVVLEDGSLEKNGCIIENENQIIDLQIKKQIENIIDEIKKME